MGSFATTRSGQAGSLIFVKCGLDSIRAVFGQSLTLHFVAFPVSANNIISMALDALIDEVYPKAGGFVNK